MLAELSSMGSSLLAWGQAALAGHGSPLAIAIALALTTLLLEDLAIAAGVALATQGFIGWPLSLLAVGGGIAIGDIALYASGAAAGRLPRVKRRLALDDALAARERIGRNLPSAILIARVIPGLRLVTYTACGALTVPLARFTAWVCLAVTLWTAGLYALSAAIGDSLARTWGIPPAMAVALPVVALALLPILWKAWKARQRPSATRTRPPST